MSGPDLDLNIRMRPRGPAGDPDPIACDTLDTIFCYQGYSPRYRQRSYQEWAPWWWRIIHNSIAENVEGWLVMHMRSLMQQATCFYTSVFVFHRA